MKLYIAEKASVGRALADALPGPRGKVECFLRCGDDIVAWAAGHLLELCMPEDYDERYKTWGFDTLLYVPPQWRRKETATAKRLLVPLKKLIRELDPQCDFVVNVGDADREGQLLIDEILDYCGWKGRALRLRINDVNAPAIRKALEDMRDNADYRTEYMAGQARLYADWLVGLALTRYVTVSLRAAGYDTPVKSVGRVQAPTLGLVVARDLEISGFSSTPYWDLRAALTFEDGMKLTGRWVAGDGDAPFLDAQRRIVARDVAQALVAKIAGGKGVVTKVEQKAHRTSPPLPYSLSKLQMAASQKHDITDTLVHLQSLYEAGYVTYPRTDCDYLPAGHFSEAPRILAAIRTVCPGMADMMSGVDTNRRSSAWNDAKVAEHHAVIPTTRVPQPDALSDKERKIYELVCARYVMQFLADYEYRETTVEFVVGRETDETGEKFRATGRVVQNLGWQGWDNSAKTEKTAKGSGFDEDTAEEGGEAEELQTLPALREGEVGSVEATLNERATKPPKAYTYHGLIKDMNNIHQYVKDAEICAKLKEIQGIGTAATQENVITTLFARGYIEKQKKNVRATELGKRLIGILGKSKASVIVKPDLTALWEQKMSDIEHGAPFEPFVREVADMVREIIADRLKIPTDIPGMTLLEKCLSPDCQGLLRRVIKKEKRPFYFCPVCRATFDDAGGKPAVREPQVTADCPVSGCKGTAVRLRTKRDGSLFWVCNTCGNFFDDVKGLPAIHARRPKKAREGAVR